MNILLQNKHGLKSRLAIAATALLMMTSMATAKDMYGSIYYSQMTGAHGYSYDYQSQGAAQQRALNECLSAGGTDCVRATWFRNACGALAVGNNNGWGSHWGNNRNGAEKNALQTCRNNTRNCRVVRWVCTAR